MVSHVHAVGPLIQTDMHLGNPAFKHLYLQNGTKVINALETT